MKRLLSLLCILTCSIATPAWADDPQTPSAPETAAETANTPAPAAKSDGFINIELDDEKLSIDADIPSVDLILSFREVQDKAQDNAESFLDAVIDSAKHEPF